MKTNIILDLDQTLICSEEIGSFDLKTHKDKTGLFDFEIMDNFYIVFERPGLQVFLDFLFKNFNVSIWTAASRDYCSFIVEKIILKKDRKLDLILFNYHCKLSKQKYNKQSKNLALLYDNFDYKKDNSIIIDDNDDVFNTQQTECIRAPPFEFTDKNSENDNFLQQLTNVLKKIKVHRSKKQKIVNSFNLKNDF